MPEGPSIVILREEAEQFKGMRVIAVSGNTKVDLNGAEGQKVIDFKTWGKHFLICFKGFTVRIHLMMFGQYRINEEKDTPVRLGMTFTNGTLNFYNCSVKFIEGDLNEVYDWAADIMSDKWDADAAKEKLKAKPD